MKNLDPTVQNYKILINGKWVESDLKHEVRNPYDGNILGTVPEARKEQIDEAIESSLRAFGIFKSTPAHRRSEILEYISNSIEKRKDEFALTIASEAGKPIKLARGEVDRAVETFKFASEEAKRIKGETIPMDASKYGERRVAFVTREPIGVICAISPFNYPLNLVAHKVAPALASGDTIILKPSTYTPITAIKLSEIIQESGIPNGVFNLLTGTGPTVGDALIEDNRFAMITFTGSLAVGRRIAEQKGFRRVTLELGSNSAVIVDANTNIEEIVPRCIFGSFAYAGQICISIQRIYVHKSIIDKFIDKFTAQASKVEVGNPLEENLIAGPMIDEKEAIRVENWIDEAVKSGAKVLTGGKRDGKFFQATVLTNVESEMRVVSEEIFAPVVSIIPFNDFDEAIELVNSSKYGLQAGIYTPDINKAFSAAERLQVGSVMINDIPTFRVDHMPYGGVKSGGIGREGLKYAIEEMTERKLVCFKL